MAYSSPAADNSFIIDDDFDPGDVPTTDKGEELGRGLLPRDLSEDPIGGFAKPFALPLIPRSEWRDRIEQREKDGATLRGKMERATLDVLHQATTNFCFPKGTLIRMADGSQKPIESIKLLDQVLTAEGNTQYVMHTMVHHTTDPIVNVKIWGHSHLRCTKEHPILTKRGYVPASRLRVGDRVAFPRYAPEKISFIQVGDYLFEKNTVKQSRRKYREYSKPQGETTVTKQIPGKTAVEITKTIVPDMIHLTPGFGRIIGLYLAEGHTNPYSVYWSFNASEEHTLAKELVELLSSELGCKPTLRIRSSSNVCQITIHGKRWVQVFDALCSRGSDEKNLHPDLTGGPTEFLKSVLYGWLDGDRKGQNSGVSISRKLALNMFDIANAIGLKPTLSTHQKAHTGKDGIDRKHSWLVGWGEHGGSNRGATRDKKNMWRKVRGIVFEEFKGHVYNFSVAGDNSYVAEGIGVHNCWYNAVVMAVMIVRMLQGQKLVRLSPASGACKITNFRNVGGWGTQALKHATNYGIVPQANWPANAIDRKYDTPANDALRKLYRVTEWWDLKPRSFDEKMTCLFYGIPVPCGYNWWGHEICAVDPIIKDGRFGTMEANSWGKSWGDNGYCILMESKSTPDDAVAPKVAVAA